MTALPSSAFWQNKKVLLTGHTGFKGAWLTLLLHRLGAKIYGYALPPTEPSLYRTAELGGLITGEYLGDIGDHGAVGSFYRSANPDITIHMAAQPLVIPSYKDPVETFRVNAIGTATLLDIIRIEDKPQIVVIVTSDKVYENKETGQFYSENDRLGGHDPYSASKACTELVAQSFYQSFFRTAPHISMMTARAGNVIGAGDWSEYRLIPDLMRAMAKNDPISLRHPGSVRPWQHVLESLTGYLLLVEKAAQDPARLAGKSFNFGPDAADFQPVSEVVKKLIKHSGSSIETRYETTETQHEAGLLHLDSTHAREVLGWQSRWNLETSLEMTAQGYRDLHIVKGSAARSVLNRQIDAYMARN